MTPLDLIEWAALSAVCIFDGVPAVLVTNLMLASGHFGASIIELFEMIPRKRKEAP